MENDNSVVLSPSDFSASELLQQYADEKIKLYKQKKGIVTDDQERIWVIYARKSTKGLKKNNDGEKVERQEKSVEEQLTLCREYAEDKKLNVLTEFVDDGISARKSGKRDDFAKMIRWIKQGKCNSILAWHPDRLARNMKEAGEIIDMLDRGEIYDLAFKTHTFIRDDNGVMTLGFQFILAKQYSDNLSAVSTRGSEEKAKLGIVPNRKPRHGYKLNKEHHFVPDGTNFNILQKAFYLALEGTPFEDIASYMNNTGFKYVGKICEMTGKKLSPIFQDQFYAGLYIYGKVKIDLTSVYPSNHPYKPMITPDEFIRLRGLLSKGQPNFNTKKSGKHELPFRGLVTCGHCSKSMSPEVTKGNSGKIFRVSCKTQDCPGNLAGLKRSIRSYELTDYIGGILLKGIETTQDAYDAYLDDMNREASMQLANHREKYRVLLSTKKRKKNTLKNLTTESMPKAKTPEAIDLINDQVAELVNELKAIESEEEIITQQISDAEYVIKHKAMSYETFSNYIKNIGHTIKTTENLAEIEKIAKMVFSNLVVEDGKVLSYSLNPNFVRYLKPTCPLVSAVIDYFRTCL